VTSSLRRALAFAALLVLVPGQVLAQSEAGAASPTGDLADPDAPDQAPLPPASPAPLPGAPAPTPPDWAHRYAEARRQLLAGEFADAAERFAELEASAVNGTDRALAREQRATANAWATRGLAFVNDPSAETSPRARPIVDRRTTDELAQLYTSSVFYGIGTGAWITALTRPQTAATAIFPFVGVVGASVGTVVALDAGRGLRYGIGQSIVSGLYIGLEHGLVWTTWANARRSQPDLSTEEHATILWGLSTAGAVGGGLLGHALGTTPGRSSWVGSTALWTGVVSGFAAGAFAEHGDPPPEAFAAAGVGLTVGTAVGLATASHVSPSISRVRFLDLGGLGGAAMAAIIYGGIAGDDADGRAASGVVALGAVGGLAAAWAITSTMAPDPRRTPGEDVEEESLITKLRPTVMPARGGAMLGVGGAL
jgi:hypothetical protein